MIKIKKVMVTIRSNNKKKQIWYFNGGNLHKDVSDFSSEIFLQVFSFEGRMHVNLT